MDYYQERPLTVTPEMQKILSKPGPLSVDAGGQRLRELYREGELTSFSISTFLDTSLGRQKVSTFPLINFHTSDTQCIVECWTASVSTLR